MSSEGFSCLAGGQWQWQGDISLLGDGPIAFTVKQEDDVGNIGSATGTITKDTQAPIYAITSDLVINLANQDSYALEGTVRPVVGK